MRCPCRRAERPAPPHPPRRRAVSKVQPAGGQAADAGLVGASLARPRRPVPSSILSCAHPPPACLAGGLFPVFSHRAAYFLIVESEFLTRSRFRTFVRSELCEGFLPACGLLFILFTVSFGKKRDVFNFEKIRFSVCSSRFIRLPSLLSNLCPITQIFALIFLLEVF